MMESAVMETNKRFWAECERQLFSMAGMDVERYQQMIVAIRALSDHLHDIGTLEALHAAWSNAETLYQEAATKSGFAPLSLPQDKISGAAFSLREREVSRKIQYEKQVSRLKEARDCKFEWIVLDETGDLQHGLMSPYSSNEMHIRSGLSIVSATQLDPSTGATVHTLSVVLLDSENGNLTDAEPGIMDWATYGNCEKFEAARTAVRLKISELSVKNSPGFTQ